MAATLIVLAHPGVTSFNASWAQASVAAAEAAGHEVLWSDLCAMDFDPVERAAHYGGGVSAAFDPLKAQAAAGGEGRMPADVAAEVEKIRKAERVIFHFPLWWFAPPAVLKGWFDRVLVHEVLHSVEARFDTGPCRGKSALFCVTTGATEAEAGPGGREGDARLLVWPAAQTLRYLGFDVLEPVFVHGVHGYHKAERRAALEARLARCLAGQADLIAGWPAHPRLAFNRDDDFDADGRLSADAPSHGPFIRH